MRIQVLCPHFTPDTAPTDTVMAAIVDGWAEGGHEVHITTSLPWYRNHAIEPEWRGKPVVREDTDWGSITRVHPFPTDKSNVPARAAAFGGFTGLATAVAATSRVGVDVVFAMSPPLTLASAGWVVAKRRRVPFVFNIQDVFPDVAVELGVMTNPRLIAASRRLELTGYKGADAVTVLSEDLAENVREKLGPGLSDRVRVIPNFVDQARVALPDAPIDYREAHDLGDKTVVMYAGNVGYSQSLGLIVDAARHFAARDDVVFVINGNGAARDDLERSASGLENLRFVDFQPPEQLGAVLRAADVHVVALASGLARSSVPSKFYSTMAVGRPLIASIDTDTEIARQVTEAESGIAVRPDDPGAFIAAVERYINDPSLRERHGNNGLGLVASQMTPAQVADTYVSLFAELIASR